MKIVKLILFFLLFLSITTMFLSITTTTFASTDVYITNGSDYLLEYVVVRDQTIVKEGIVGVDEQVKTKLQPGNYEVVWWKQGQNKFKIKRFSVEDKNAMIALILFWPREKLDGTFSKTPENFSLTLDRNNIERRQSYKRFICV